MAAALPAAEAELRVVLLPAVVAVLRAELRVLLLLAVEAELPALRAHKPRLALALPAVEAELRVVLPEVGVAPAARVELLSRPSFSAATARTTP